MSADPCAHGVIGESLVLLSAGVESATLLHRLVLASRAAAAPAPRALCVDYGQRASAQERVHAKRLCDALGVELEHLAIAEVGAAFRRGQTLSRHVPIPHRNLFLLATTLCWAVQFWGPRVRAGTLYIALNRDDAEAHPDATCGFLERLNALTAELGALRIAAPLLDQSKAEIVRQGHAAGLDYGLTYSCLLGHAQHCGACPQCDNRRLAFAQAGVAEPTDFYQHPRLERDRQDSPED